MLSVSFCTVAECLSAKRTTVGSGYMGIVPTGGAFEVWATMIQVYIQSFSVHHRSSCIYQVKSTRNFEGGGEGNDLA